MNPSKSDSISRQPPALDEFESMDGQQDYLADALIYLAAHHGRAISHQALIAGLPTTDGKLTAALVERAGLRAGLEIEPVQRAVADIPALVLPALLIMKNRPPFILVGINGLEGTATVVDTTRPDTREVCKISELTVNYSGYTFLVRPTSTVDARTVAAGDLPRTHWFWSVVRKFGSNYWHVALAAFLVQPKHAVGRTRAAPDGGLPDALSRWLW